MVSHLVYLVDVHVRRSCLTTPQISLSLLAGASLAVALPSSLSDSHPSRRAQQAVQVFPADVHGPNITALRPAPSDLSSSLRSFLEKYQPLANSASEQIGAKNQAVFTSAGHCFAEFPCFSVERGAMATIGDQEEVTQEQLSAILDRLVLSPTVTFEHDASTPLSGLKLTVNHATLEVVAAHGSVPSTFLAGMVFDMYKMQHDDPATNSIRAVQAQTDGVERPFVALCVYPEGADPTQAHDFCLGSDLVGGTMAATQAKEKRFSFERLLGGVCSILDFPLVCDNPS
jgi:hypothetical protein